MAALRALLIVAFALTLVGRTVGDGHDTAEKTEPTDDGGYEDVDDYVPITKEEYEQECEEKLEIVSFLVAENGKDGEFGDDVIKTVRKANGDGYPENSLGYVWCSRFVGGLQKAKDNTGEIEMFIAPYLPTEDLPMSVNDVDKLGGNQLESAALKAVTDKYSPDTFKSQADYDDVNKANVEATYPWSGAASLEGQAPSLGQGKVAPQKTSIARLIAAPGTAYGQDGQDVYMCACGVYTSDMSAEMTNKQTSDQADGGNEEGESEDGDGSAETEDTDEDGGDKGDDEAAGDKDDAGEDKDEGGDDEKDEGVGDQGGEDKDTDDKKDEGGESEAQEGGGNRKLLRSNRATARANMGTP